MARVDRLSAWLKRASPSAHRVVRPAWRAVRPYLPRDRAYWKDRVQFQYYAEVVRLARQYVPDGGRVVDVGAGRAQFLERLDWFEHRVALDAALTPRQRHIKSLRTDFVAYEPDRPFDLAVCLQVLEHLAAPAPFARKLFETGRTVIISVPYRWPAGLYPTHIQDPVDEEMLAEWTGRAPTETLIVTDNRPRLIAVYA